MFSCNVAIEIIIRFLTSIFTVLCCEYQNDFLEFTVMGVKGVNYTIVNSRALREPISAHFHFALNLIIFAFTGLVGKALELLHGEEI